MDKLTPPTQEQLAKWQAEFAAVVSPRALAEFADDVMPQLFAEVERLSKELAAAKKDRSSLLVLARGLATQDCAGFCGELEDDPHDCLPALARDAIARELEDK